MKKLFITMMAFAALVSCSKSDIIYSENTEIFFTPATQKTTKAAVSTNDYPDLLNMYVFAKAGYPNITTNAGGEQIDNGTYTEDYLKNAEFSNTGRSANIFGGANTIYYWPNVKKLKFTGFSKSGNIGTIVSNTIDYPTYTNNTITIKGYEPGNGIAGENENALGKNDLMWFPITPSAYGKETTKVPVTMKHACSWITIYIKGNNITGASNTTWKIDKLELKNISLRGTAELSETAKWDENNLSAAEPVTLQESTTGVSLTYSDATDFKGVDYTVKTETNGVTYDNLVVIPQSPCDLEITYSYLSQGADTPENTDDIKISETKSVSLAFNGNAKWEAGVHYTYTITIGANEILIEPTTSTWTTGTGNFNTNI